MIRTAQIEEGGLRVGPLQTWLLQNRFTKLLTRTFMLTRAMDKYKKAAFDESVELWQAGKGVDAITAVESCAEVMERFGAVAHVDHADGV